MSSSERRGSSIWPTGCSARRPHGPGRRSSSAATSSGPSPSVARRRPSRGHRGRWPTGFSTHPDVVALGAWAGEASSCSTTASSSTSKPPLLERRRRPEESAHGRSGRHGRRGPGRPSPPLRRTARDGPTPGHLGCRSRGGRGQGRCRQDDRARRWPARSSKRRATRLGHGPVRPGGRGARGERRHRVGHPGPLHGRARWRAAPSAPATCVVVDEAGMVGTRTIGPAGRGDRRVGRQAGPGRRSPPAARDRGRRSLRHAWPSAWAPSSSPRTAASTSSGNARALDQLRSGDVGQGLAAYDAHDRIHLAPTMAETRNDLVEHWLEARELGRALMLAVNRRDVDGPQRTWPGPTLRAHGVLGADVLRTDERSLCARATRWCACATPGGSA